MKRKVYGTCSGCRKPLWSRSDAGRGHHGGACTPERRGPRGIGKPLIPKGVSDKGTAV